MKEGMNGAQNSHAHNDQNVSILQELLKIT